MKRVLVITRGAWNSSNNTGNTINNLFAGNPDFELYSLYLRSEEVDDTCPCHGIFRITEGQLINNLLHGQTCGEVVNAENNRRRNVREDNAYKISKKVNLYTLWWVRELLWSIGKWNNEAFKHYIRSVSPDIVFMPVFGCFYPHKILQKIHELTSAKLVLYHADDNYSLRQFNFSPAYWLYRLRLRYWVRNSVKIASANYAISSIQRDDYQRSLHREFKILQKFSDFSLKPIYPTSARESVKLVFSGNVSSGRWRTLAQIGRALDEINSDGNIAHLDIYTGTELTKRMLKALDCRSVNLKGFISSSEVAEVQANADILVHVESFKFKNRLEVRQSFSTKIVDYLNRAKCILAVGPLDVASIRYLYENEAAYVVSDLNSLTIKLENLLTSENLIREYAEKGWAAGERNHGIEKRMQFQSELGELV